MNLTLLVLCFVITLNTGYCNYSNRGNRRKFSMSSSIEYYTDPGHHLSIPILIHFDKALTDRLAVQYKIKTRKLLKEFSRSILREAENMYKHPSLNQSIHLLLQDTRFLRKNKIAINENGSTYLKNYCTWQGERKKAGKRWWYSILLTGVDLYYINSKGDQVRSGTGRGYLGGMCASDKSCTVLEWNPRNIGYLVSHEIGHSLGMSHDGPPHNACRPHVNVMTSKYNPLHHPKSWSQCSKQDLQKFLLSRKGWCVRYSNFENRSIGKLYKINANVKM